jgi:hypothetical protein
MPGKPAEPSPFHRSESVAPGAGGEQGQPAERVGPLAIARHVKDDGRVLIIYTRSERDWA